MAVVKASYAKGGSSGAIRYAVHREADSEKEYRTGFTAEREGLDTKSSIDELKQYEHGKGYTYHIVLNPGDGRDTPTDLQQWTRETMRELEQKHGRSIPYIAVIHNDHSEHAHVHVIAHTERTLNRQELNHVRQEATRLYDHQREMHRETYHTPENQHKGVEQREVQPQLKEGPGKEFAQQFAQRYAERQARVSGRVAEREEKSDEEKESQRAKWQEKAARLTGSAEGTGKAGGSSQEHEGDSKKVKQRQYEWGR